MPSTDIKDKIHILHDKVDQATDIDLLKGYAHKLIELLGKVDELVDLNKEQVAALESKADIYQTVGKNLVDVIVAIKETLDDHGILLLQSVTSLDEFIEEAQEVFRLK